MKFKCPKSFLVKGRRWHIKFVGMEQLTDPDGSESYAIAHMDVRTIVVDRELKKDPALLEEIMLHEVWHVAFKENHLDQVTEMTGDVEEVMCDLFADTVIETLKKYFYK